MGGGYRVGGGDGWEQWMGWVVGKGREIGRDIAGLWGGDWDRVGIG